MIHQDKKIKLIHQDKKWCLATLEQSLLSAAKGRAIEISIANIRKIGLIKTLRERGRRG